MLDQMRTTLRRVALAVTALAVVGCAAVRPLVGEVTGSPATLDRVTLAADGRSVDVVIVGDAPLSEGKTCGADFALTSSAMNGTTLEILVKQTARRVGDCVLTELVCCEHRFTVPVPEGQFVERVRDLSAEFERYFYVTRPTWLYALPGLPNGWKLRREWADWGGTWTRLYSPLSDPPAGSNQTLMFSETIGGQIVIEPEALQSPVIVNGAEATYHRYPDVDNQIQLQWLADGQKLALETFEVDFSIDALTALANSATPE